MMKKDYLIARQLIDLARELLSSDENELPAKPKPSLEPLTFESPNFPMDKGAKPKRKMTLATKRKIAAALKRANAKKRKELEE